MTSSCASCLRSILRRGGVTWCRMAIWKSLVRFGLQRKETFDLRMRLVEPNDAGPAPDGNDEHSKAGEARPQKIVSLPSFLKCFAIRSISLSASDRDNASFPPRHGTSNLGGVAWRSLILTSGAILRSPKSEF